PASWPDVHANSSQPARTSTMRRVLRAAPTPAYIALLLIVAVGFWLRVENNGYGLPYVYNVDEGSHFTARAVAMLGGDWDPHYFQNPSAFTYLATIALRLRFGHGNPFGSFGHLIHLYGTDPTAIYRTTRTVPALLCTVGVVAAFWAGSRSGRWWRRARASPRSSSRRRTSSSTTPQPTGSCRRRPPPPATSARSARRARARPTTSGR